MRLLPEEYEGGFDPQKAMVGMWNALLSQDLFIGFCYGQLQKLRSELRRVRAELMRASFSLAVSRGRERELAARCAELEADKARLSRSMADALERIRKLEEGERESEYAIEAAAGIVRWCVGQRQNARSDS